MSTVLEYFSTLAQQAGLDDESKAGLLKALGNPKFAEEVDKGVKRQSDYSRAMDEANRVKAEAESKINEWRTWYTTAVATDAERETELQTLRARVSGNPDPNPNPNQNPSPTGLTQKQLEEREGRMISIVKQGMRLASRHAAKFGEELDVDAIEKIAVEKGLTLDRAYDEYIQPRVKAATDADVEARIKKAREEGVVEGLSKRDVPGEADRGHHPLFGKRDPATTGNLSESQRSANFANAWAEAATKK